MAQNRDNDEDKNDHPYGAGYNKDIMADSFYADTW